MIHTCTLSRHAKKRQAQRAISDAMLNFLAIYGDETLQKGGTSILSIPRRIRKKAIKDLKSLLVALQNSKSPYCVLSDDGTVITIGHEL